MEIYNFHNNLDNKEVRVKLFCNLFSPTRDFRSVALDPNSAADSYDVISCPVSSLLLKSWSDSV
jgi:hypothetical protein